MLGEGTRAQDEHVLDVGDLLARYETTWPQGLSTAVARKRLERDGRNELVRGPPRGLEAVALFVRSALSYFGPLLYAGVALALIAYGFDPTSYRYIYTAAVLFASALVIAIFAFLELRKETPTKNDLQILMPRLARTHRDGFLTSTPATDLVAGDIVELQRGDAAPADVRLIQVSGCRIEMSALTGVPDLLPCTVEATSDNPLQTRNMVFFGSTVQEGSATGVVILTGYRTLLGRLARHTFHIRHQTTPISRELSKFIRGVGAASVALACAFLVCIIAVGLVAINAAVYMIGIISGMVPEALLIAARIATRHVKARLARRNVLTRQPSVIETVGRTTVICTDKNGVLTQNRVVLAHMVLNGETTDQTGYPALFASGSKSPAASLFLRAAVLCNRAALGPEPDEASTLDREMVGNGTDVALLRFGETLINTTEFRARHPLRAEMVYSANERFQATIHWVPDGAGGYEHLLLMRGAAAVVLERCVVAQHNTEIVPLSAALRQWYQDIADGLARQGDQVQALAQLRLPADQFPVGFAFDLDRPNFPLTGLHFIGFAGLLDPPREDVAAAIALCRSASIQVVMVTSDLQKTSQAVAQQIGLIRPDQAVIVLRDCTTRDAVLPASAAVIVTGSALSHFDDYDWATALALPTVMLVEVSPKQKELLVHHCKRLGAFVTATGDSVQDTRALRLADVAMAMGVKGTDVSRAAASLVVMDDSFATVAAVVAEGRLFYANLAKSVAYVTTSNVAEVVPFFVFLTVQLPLAVTTSLILCIDIGSDLWPAITFAYEPPEPDLMTRPPPRQKRYVVTADVLLHSTAQAGVVQCLAAFFAFLVALGDSGFAPWMLVGRGFQWDNPRLLLNGRGSVYRGEALAYAQTAYFAAILIMQCVNMVVCKTRSASVFTHGMRNAQMNWSLVFCVLFMLVVVYFPYFNPLFNTRILNAEHLLPALPFAVFTFAHQELRKWHLRRSPDGRESRNRSLYTRPF